VNSGAHRVDGSVETRGNEASADNRQLIIGTGLIQCAVGRIATARHEDVKMKPYRQFGSTAVTGDHATTRVTRSGIRHCEISSGLKCGCVAVKSLN
jgi:hypothetical protein